MRGEFRWLALLGVAALAVVLFVVLRPSGDNGDGETTVARTITRNKTTTAATVATATQTATSISIDIEGGKPTGGVADATVKKGTKVVLFVHSDVADEIHLHGYDKHVDVEAGGTARLPFTADIAGRFEAELEDRHEKILDLTVEP